MTSESNGIQQAESSDSLHWLGAALAMISNVRLMQGPYKIISVLSSELVSSALDTQRVNPNTTGYYTASQKYFQPYSSLVF